MHNSNPSQLIVMTIMFVGDLDQILLASQIHIHFEGKFRNG